MNKKGAEMTIGTIVIIILCLVVLVIIVLGFSMGWRSLWDKIMNLGGGGSSFSSVAQSCQISCETGDINGYCFIAKEWKEEGVKKSAKCFELVDQGKIAGCDNPAVACKK